MEAKLPPRLGIGAAKPSSAQFSARLSVVIVILVAATFGANHVAARTAFDHGVSIPTGIAARATGTALVLFILMKAQGVALTLERRLMGRILLTGVLVLIQSYCLYSAVARIPIALALLVFNTCPVLYLVLSWATRREAPRTNAVAATLVALFGLALALGIQTETFPERWEEIGAGVAWALSGAASFTLVIYSNAYWLKGVDGRLRTFLMTGIAALLVLAVGGASDALALPADRLGWLGVALLTIFYCVATCAFFIALPRLAPASIVALNFEPIALLGMGWVFLGQSVALMQILGAVVTVSAIVWLGAAKR
jgi:drug/metabolite transporter (DMT)-like permease